MTTIFFVLYVYFLIGAGVFMDCLDLGTALFWPIYALKWLFRTFLEALKS